MTTDKRLPSGHLRSFLWGKGAQRKRGFTHATSDFSSYRYKTIREVR